MTRQVSDPIVSICIPTFNGEAFLKEALESASAQSFGDIEILVTDDGSTDGTCDIIHDHARQDARVRFLSHRQTLGLVGNWNHCLMQARGSWVKWLFQDDLLDPDCLDTLMTAAEEAHACFAASSRRFKFEAGVSPDQVGFYERHRQRVGTLLRPGFNSPEQVARQAASLQEYNLVGEPPVTLLHKRAIARVGLFDPLLIHMVDAEYWTRVGVHFGLVFVDRDLCTFRVHGASTSSDNHHRRHFVTSTLDPIVLKYKLMFDPVFAEFRDQAQAQGRLSEIERGLWYACRRARLEAIRQERLGQTAPAEAWQALAQRLPLLHRLAATGPVHRALLRASGAAA